MSDRAVSTVLDVSVSLLLVGAAVLTLLNAPATGPDPADGRAEEVATTLAGSTATVQYGTGEDARTVHGTQVGLLADAAVSNLSTSSGRPFRTAVANATRPTLGGSEWRAQVVATWQPYDGSDGGARVRVGDEPPGDADVHTATMTVPSGLDPARAEALVAAERDGFEGVGAVVAAAVVDADSGRPAEADVESDVVTGLAASFEEPTAAAEAVSVGRVHVGVRAWSA